MEEVISQRRIALLVDGDNMSADPIKEILAEISKFGTVVIRRVYGDWSQPTMQKWKVSLQDHGLKPVQQFANIAGKNATDSALIIDAMDILHDEVVQGFCIVSSDSDYTSLAGRLREHGSFVIGIGEEKTHVSFRNACDRFVLLENLRVTESVETSKSTKVVQKGPTIVETKNERSPKDALPVLLKAYDNIEGGQVRVTLANLGVALTNLDSGFDPRTYGRKKLINLVEALPNHFVVESDKKNGGTINIRRREAGVKRGQARGSDE